MKKQTAAALALIAVPALAGAATMQDTATAGTTTYTRHLVLHQTGTHNLGKYDFAGTDKISDRSTGKFLGYDAITGHFDPKANTARIHAALALKGGLLIARVHNVTENSYKGRITGGTGAYQGVTGTLIARDVGHGKTLLNLTYTL